MSVQQNRFGASLSTFFKYTQMTNHERFDVIIVGGSYAGLSAAMSLGRAIRKVLVIDGGQPCNIQTPHSHNFITQDGQTPTQIATAAQAQVARYDTVTFYNGLAMSGQKTEKNFAIKTQTGDLFTAKKLIFATGLKDIMPDLKGFAECWGISIIHCPYCHGYEVRNQKTGIIGNGADGFHYARLISNWTKELLLFTNGPAALTAAQTAQLAKHHIPIIETEIDEIEHENGRIKNVIFKDQAKVSVKAVYSRPKFVQHSPLPVAFGCELTEQGLLKVDTMQRTSVPGIYASGDNASGRAVAVAVSTGTLAGACANNDLIEEEF